MGPFLPNAPNWLTGSAKGAAKKKKKQVAKSPDGKMPTPESKLSQSVSVSGKKKKKGKGKKKVKARAESPATSTKDETFVTVEEIDPQEEEMVNIKKEPVSPTLPKATVFEEAVAPEGSVADEHFSTPLQSPVPANAELTKENAPLRSESCVPLPRYPPYEHAKRSASPSPSSQLHVENPAALMMLVNNINSRNEKNSSMKARSPQKLQKSTPVPNSTLDQNFPPTSPLNSKTPGPMPGMMQFDSSPNRFSPSKSNKCTPVPLPTIKGFPAAPKLGTPFRAGAGAEDDPLTPADVNEILNRVMEKNDSGDEHGDTEMHDAEEHVVVSPAAGKRGIANGEESDVDMTTVIKDEQHGDSAADGPVKKTKKSKKDKKRRLEESNALDDDESITVSAPKKAKKTKKKKAKKISVEEEHEITMELDGTTQFDDSTVVGETTQLEVDMQLEEAMQLNNTEHGGASETLSAPKDVEELTAEHEVTEIVDESTSTGKKKKTKKSRKNKKAQIEVEDHQVIEIDEVVAPVIYVAVTEQSTKADQVTDAAAATEFSPAPEAKVTKKGRKAKDVPTELEPEEPESAQEDTVPTTTASNVAATMTANPLLAIAKQVVKFDNNLSFHSETFQGELSTIKSNLAALEQRIQANELRDSYRQEILFNALKKIFSTFKGEAQAQADHHNGRSNSPDSSPASADGDRLARSVRATTVGPNGSVHSVTPIPLPKLGKRAFSSHHRETPASGAGVGAKVAGSGVHGAAIAEARKNQDKLLAGFTEEMNAAKDAKTVDIKGRLCVKYADDLFKMF